MPQRNYKWIGWDWIGWMVKVRRSKEQLRLLVIVVLSNPGKISAGKGEFSTTAKVKIH